MLFDLRRLLNDASELDRGRFGTAAAAAAAFFDAAGAAPGAEEGVRAALCTAATEPSVTATESSVTATAGASSATL